MKHAGLHRLVDGRGVGPKGFLGGLSVATGQRLQVSLLESSDPGFVGPVPATASFTHAGSPGCRSCIGHSKTVLMVLRSDLCSGQIQGRTEYMRTKGCQCAPWTLCERVLAHRALAEKKEPQRGFKGPRTQRVLLRFGARTLPTYNAPCGSPGRSSHRGSAQRRQREIRTQKIGGAGGRCLGRIASLGRGCGRFGHCGSGAIEGDRRMPAARARTGGGRGGVMLRIRHGGNCAITASRPGRAGESKSTAFRPLAGEL